MPVCNLLSEYRVRYSVVYSSEFHFWSSLSFQGNIKQNIAITSLTTTSPIKQLFKQICVLLSEIVLQVLEQNSTFEHGERGGEKRRKLTLVRI